MATTHQLPKFTNPYDVLASEYDELFDKSTFYSLVTQKEEALLKGLVGSSNGSNAAVDVGCGTGDYTILLAQNGYKTLGIDLSYQMLKIAEAKARTLNCSNPPIFLNQDALTLSHLGQEFDLIVCLGSVLNHVDDWEQFFREMSACLKPGGKIIFSFDNLFAPDEFYWSVKNARPKRLVQTLISRMLSRTFVNEWPIKAPGYSLNVHLTYESLQKVRNLLRHNQLHVSSLSGAHVLSCFLPSVLNSSVRLGPPYKPPTSVLSPLRQWFLSLDKKVADAFPSFATNIIMVAVKDSGEHPNPA